MAEMNKGLVVAKLKTAENLYESLNRAETNITQEITNTKIDRDYFDRKLNGVYYSYQFRNSRSVQQSRADIQRLEGTLLNTYGLEYRCHGEEKRMHSVVDERIASLYKGMQHRGNNERQILKDIKEAEEEKRQLAIIASEATKNRKSNWTKDGSVEEIQQRIDHNFSYIDKVLWRDMSERAERKPLWKDLEWHNRYINRLEKKLANISKRKHAAQRLVAALRKQRDEV